MILPALLALHPTLFQTAEERGLVKAFVTTARIGIEPGIVLPPHPTEGEEPISPAYLDDPKDLRLGFRHFQYAHTTISFDTLNKRVWAYHENAYPNDAINPDGSPKPRLVSDAQAIALARRFYTAAGYSKECAVMPVPDESGKFREVLLGQGHLDTDLLVYMVPAAGGVMFDETHWQSMVYVDYRTGQLMDFHSPGRDVPSPPLSLTPRGSVDAARSIALRFGVDRVGESLAESPYHPFRLRVWYPQVGWEDRTPVAQRAYSAPVRAAVDAKRGVLAYVGRLAGGSWQSGIGVVIDATTGEVIETRRPDRPGGGGGAGGGSPTAPKGALDVPTVARLWRVSTAKAGWGAWTAPATAALTPSSSKNATGKKVLLTDGRVAFPAVYDLKTNLLGIDGKAYRPGPALATLLRKRAK